MRLLALFILFALGISLPSLSRAQTPPRPPASAVEVAFDAQVVAIKEAMMADPSRALALARTAQEAAAKLPSQRMQASGKATAQWLESEALIGLNRAAEAKPIAEEALELVDQQSPDTKLHGDLLRALAGIAAVDGRIQEALLLYQRAHDIFRRAGEQRSRAIVLQDIGQIYWEAGDYPRVLDYFRQSEEAFPNDPGLMLTMRNNRGEVLRAMGRFSEAQRDYLAALEDARGFDSPMLEARILTNLATAQALDGDLDAAEQSVRAGLRLARDDAAEWRPFLIGVAAEIASRRGQQQRAASLLDQVFADADLATTPMPFRELHQLASNVYQRVGQSVVALDHLRAFQRLDKEAQGLIASSASQLMAARFDSANQKARIASLKQGQLERDIRIERQQTRYRTILFIGLASAGTIVIILLLASALRIRRSRNETRAANTILTQVNLKLEKALKAKTEFLAMTSHEIRTPLNGILGMTQILLTNRTLDAEVRGQVQLVHGAGETMRTLVDDILDVAKMETGEVAVMLEDVDLRPVLDNAARLWRGHATTKGVALEVDIERAPDRIRSDEARIRQIVFNLLSNAVKFTASGSIKLRAQLEDGAQPHLVIEVEDTGIGIPEEHRERVFESFQQVDRGTTRQFSGTGLGLAICRNLAAALGGTIELKSEVGVGSTFTVRIPYEPAASVVATRGPAAALPQSRMLLLEANAMTQGVMRALLEPVVQALECVEDAEAAIGAVATGSFDHLLIEAKSAVITGGSPVDGLRQLVAAAAAAQIPVTILIAPSDDLPLGDVAQLGATKLVVKPVGGSALVAALHEAHEEFSTASSRAEAA